MYENAKKGIGKVFTSQILAILAVISALIASLFFAVNLTTENANIMTNPLGENPAIAIFALITVVLLMIAYIVEIVGLNQAGKDEPLIKKAFVMAIIGLIFSIILGSLYTLSLYKWINDILDVCNFFIGLIIVHHVLYGIANICPSISDKAVNVWRVYMATIIIALIVNVVSVVMALLKLYTGSAVLLIAFTVFDTILQIVAYVMFVGFLAKAKKEIR